MKIRCIDIQKREYGDGKHLTFLKEYKVLKEDKNTYLIKNDINEEFRYRKERFKISNENIELNIIEASNMPYGTEFKVKIDCYYKYDDACRIRDNTKLIAVNTQSGIKFKEYVDVERASKSLINAKFIPIQELVDFIVAWEAFEDGKTIESTYTLDRYKKIDGLIKIKHQGGEFEKCGNIATTEIGNSWIILD